MLKNGRTPLHICADFGQVDVIKYLISEGADVNVGDPPLPSTLLPGYWEELTVSLLPQALDKHGHTPLLAAAFESHIDCVKLLLEKVGAATGAGVLMR